MIDSLVEQISERHAELERLMSDPEVIGDRERYAEVGREYRQLGQASELAGRWRQLKGDFDGAEAVSYTHLTLPTTPYV